MKGGRGAVCAATLLALLVCSASAHAAPEADRCAALATDAPPNIRVLEAKAVREEKGAPAFCRVRGETNPTADSHIGFELWLPASDWNGRYYQLGNGGFAGNIQQAALVAELRAGNAAAITDTGHHGDGFDASWARGHPEQIVDYGYRSLQVTAEAAQALIHAYYGKPARYRYFAGCSNGGRQALMVAQRYPQLWDGILAGAPAYDWTRQLATFAWIQHALRTDQANWIAPEKLPAIQRTALASCTPAAHVVDGIPADPRFCAFEPRKLLCKGAETHECLTAAQVETLETIQNGPRAPASTQPLFFGFEPTAAAVPDNWQRWIVNPDRRAKSQLTFAEQFYGHVVLGTAEWTVERFDAARDFTAASDRMISGQPLSRVLDATSTDLVALQRHGAKLLMYIGWADAVLAPRAGLDYYVRVSRAFGGFEPTRRFFRLFMVPGMTHCQGGPAPNAFGQSFLSEPLSDDARHDIRRALEAWVEHGSVPQSLIAAKYIDDDARRGVAATSLLCPFPQRADVRNSRDARDASSYVCVDN